MIWISFALGMILFESLKIILSKSIINKKIDEYTISWAFRFFSALLLIPFLFVIDIPQLNNKFWMALFISGILNAFTTVLVLKAIKNSDVSLVSPISSFTPLFMLFISPFVLNEIPNIYGALGVLAIVLGTYILNIDKRKIGIFEPFIELIRQPGPKIMLMVSLLWAFSSVFDKVGVLNSSPFFWVIAINIFLTIVLFPLMIYKTKQPFRIIETNFSGLFLIGIFSTISLFFQMLTIELTLATFVIALKRSGILLTSILAYFIFKEKNIKERLVGAFVMIIGVLLITLF